MVRGRGSGSIGIRRRRKRGREGERWEESDRGTRVCVGGESGETEGRIQRVGEGRYEATRNRIPRSLRQNGYVYAPGFSHGETRIARLEAGISKGGSLDRTKNSLEPNLVISKHQVGQDPRQLLGGIVRYDGLHLFSVSPATSFLASMLWYSLAVVIQNRRRRFACTVRMFAFTLESVVLYVHRFLRFGSERAGDLGYEEEHNDEKKEEGEKEIA